MSRGPWFFQLVVRLPGIHRVRPRDTLPLSALAHHLHLFDTERGPMAVVLVGAMIVAAIDTVWAGQVAPAAHGLKVSDYRQASPPVHLEKGLELGRFRLGSTAIVLFGPDMMDWRQELATGAMVRMGERLGSLR